MDGPFLLTRKAAAARVGMGETYFDEMIAPRAVPIMVGRDARWTVAELGRVVQVLQEEARQKRERRPCPSDGDPNPMAGSSTSRSKAGRGSGAPSPAASPSGRPSISSEAGARTSKLGVARAIYLRPIDGQI